MKTKGKMCFFIRTFTPCPYVKEWEDVRGDTHNDLLLCFSPQKGIQQKKRGKIFVYHMSAYEYVHV